MEGYALHDDELHRLQRAGAAAVTGGAGAGGQPKHEPTLTLAGLSDQLHALARSHEASLGRLDGLAEAQAVLLREVRSAAAGVHELQVQVDAERLRDVRKSTSELEEQLSEAQSVEQSLKGRLRALTAAAQAEVERGTAQIGELHDARQRQLRLEHAQLAELHAQSSGALNGLAEQREALKLEAEAHRHT